MHDNPAKLSSYIIYLSPHRRDHLFYKLWGRHLIGLFKANTIEGRYARNAVVIENGKGMQQADVKSTMNEWILRCLPLC